MKSVPACRLLLCLLLGALQGYAQERGAEAAARPDTERALELHNTYLDSALAVKDTDLKKSIDFITQSIAILGPEGHEKEIAASLAALGEIYLNHNQRDLAIANLEESLGLYKSSETTLKLAGAYVANGEYDRAENLLRPLTDAEGMAPYRRVVLYETLGDAKAGMGQTNEAIAFYKEGLLIADKNQIAPKVTDLNSKIADTYAGAGRLQEARAYYDNSLELAGRQAPERAVREKEKVADFFNKNQQYQEEIALRKKSLDALKEQPPPQAASKAPGEEGDEVSPQRIAYKIANAYVARQEYDKAIPYLRESIAGAGADDDLQVQKDATRALSEVYRSKGDFNRALATYRDYVTLVDSLYKRKEQQLAQMAQFNREIAEKQSRITGLEQERELTRSRYELALSEQRLVQERNKRQQLLIYFLILGIALLALSTFFFYRSNRQQKLANNLLALKSLRSQMNPHFIFNALNSVNNYIAKKDVRSANRYLGEFAALMRAVLENSELDFIPLSRELEWLTLYLRLEHSRFPEQFEYEVTVDEALDPEKYRIPPMLLQPYLENAIWHGLRYREDKGRLQVGLEETGPGSLQISITDNGIGRRRSAELKTGQQKKQRSRAMENIRKRIGILNDMYGDRIAVAVEDLEADGSGTRVILTLKKQE